MRRVRLILLLKAGCAWNAIRTSSGWSVRISPKLVDGNELPVANAPCGQTPTRDQSSALSYGLEF